jgi:predicted HTH domain antitoxin
MHPYQQAIALFSKSCIKALPLSELRNYTLCIIMSTLTVNLRLPRDLLGALDISEAQLEARILELVALELFRQERISSGKGAELLGISKWEFIQLLAQHGIPYFTDSSEELAAEVATAQSLLGQKNPWL